MRRPKLAVIAQKPAQMLCLWRMLHNTGYLRPTCLRTENQDIRDQENSNNSAKRKRHDRSHQRCKEPFPDPFRK